MVKISNARIDMERARVDNALFKDYGEILVGGATGANTGAAFSIDLSAGNAFKIIVNTAIVDLAFINAGPSGTMTSFTLIVQQDSVGGRKINWPGTVLWDGGSVPTLSAIYNKIDIFTFLSADGGRKWYGFTGQQNLTGFNLSTATLWTWGRNPGGQLGTNDTATRLIPTAIDNGSWSVITISIQDAFGIKADGSLWGWGSNTGGVSGELGNNSGVNVSSPVAIGTLTNWATVITGSYHTHAIKTNGTLWGWGQNGANASVAPSLIGDNTSVARSSPVQIGALTNWSTLATFNTSGASTGAIDTSGHLFMWGLNSNGSVGDNTVTTRSSPVQIGTLTNWASVTMSQSTTFAIKTDHTLWAWGLNNASQIPSQTTTSFSSPVQIGTLTNWSSVVGSYFGGTALKTDGTLWSWGNNAKGQLGDNTVTTRSSPVQIGTLTNWSNVAMGRYNVAALKTDGTLWAWGGNVYGQLGTGDTNNRSSPVQIGPATTWTKIGAGGNNGVMAIKGPN